MLNSSTAPECASLNIKWVTRPEWDARDPKKPLTPNINFKYLVVHHTSNIGTCISPDDCKLKARKVQDKHMDSRGFDDVGYNFFIDPFGSVLVGRGFDVEGGHTYRYNCDAYGVNFMGSFRTMNPTTLAIEAFNNLAIVKFMFSKEATKIDKLTAKILSIFVAFSENVNFTTRQQADS